MALTIRTDKNIEKEIEEIKEEYDLKASSKIIYQAVMVFRNNNNFIEALQSELSEAQEELSELKNLIKKYFLYESEIKKIL